MKSASSLQCEQPSSSSSDEDRLEVKIKSETMPIGFLFYFLARMFVIDETSQAAKSLGCFSGNTKVTLSDGQQKLMSRLEIGDRILTLNSRGNLEYSPVLLFMHRSPRQRSPFLRIQMESGINITITRSHLILRWEKSRMTSLYEALPIYARDVKEGDQLLTKGHNSDEPLSVDIISSIETLFETGVYAPLTETGTIVVNDIVASCYAVIYSQRLADYVFAPVRLYYNLKTSFNNYYNLVRNQFVTESRNTTMVVATHSPPDGVHWYCRLWYGMANVFVPRSWLEDM